MIQLIKLVKISCRITLRADDADISELAVAIYGLYILRAPFVFFFTFKNEFEILTSAMIRPLDIGCILGIAENTPALNSWRAHISIVLKLKIWRVRLDLKLLVEERERENERVVIWRVWAHKTQDCFAEGRKKQQRNLAFMRSSRIAYTCIVARYEMGPGFSAQIPFSF